MPTPEETSAVARDEAMGVAWASGACTGEVLDTHSSRAGRTGSRWSTVAVRTAARHLRLQLHGRDWEEGEADAHGGERGGVVRAGADGRENDGETRRKSTAEATATAPAREDESGHAGFDSDCWRRVEERGGRLQLQGRRRLDGNDEFELRLRGNGGPEGGIGACGAARGKARVARRKRGQQI